MWRFAVFVGLLLLLAPLAAPYDAMTTDTAIALQPPSAFHVFGTDALGRDVLSRVLVGGQRTLISTLMAAGIAFAFGTALGSMGILAPSADGFFRALTNALLAFPGLVAALIVLTMLGRGWLALAVATGVGQVAPCAVFVRAVLVGIRGEAFIEAAHSLGVGRWGLFRRCYVPNALPSLVGYAAVLFGVCLLNYGALTFLGLGGEPGVPDWGVLLAEGRTVLRAAPWVALAPGVCITMLVYGANRLARRIR